MDHKHTLTELNNCSREELITMVLSMQGQLDMLKVLRKAVPLFDGGFNFSGLVGNGSAFVVRDAHGIRPSYYYINDEVIVAASERAAIRTAFNVGENEVKELMPGQGLLVDPDGNWQVEEILELTVWEHL